jgi:hypothetical protein
MSQTLPFQSVKNHNPLRIGQITFTILALLALAVGTIILSLLWFGLGVTTTGKDVYADAELRGFVFIVIWPATMLAVWIFSTLAFLLAKRWILASVALPVAFGILYAIWYIVALFLLNVSGVWFTALYIMLNTGAIWLASWFLRKPAQIQA